MSSYHVQKVWFAVDKKSGNLVGMYTVEPELDPFFYETTAAELFIFKDGRVVSGVYEYNSKHPELKIDDAITSGRKDPTTGEMRQFHNKAEWNRARESVARAFGVPLETLPPKFDEVETPPYEPIPDVNAKKKFRRPEKKEPEPRPERYVRYEPGDTVKLSDLYEQQHAKVFMWSELGVDGLPYWRASCPQCNWSAGADNEDFIRNAAKRHMEPPGFDEHLANVQYDNVLNIYSATCSKCGWRYIHQKHEVVATAVNAHEGNV